MLMVVFQCFVMLCVVLVPCVVHIHTLSVVSSLIGDGIAWYGMVNGIGMVYGVYMFYYDDGGIKICA